MKIRMRESAMRKITKRMKDDIDQFFAEMKEDKIGYLFFVIFIFLVTLISMINWTHLEQYINDDSAGEFLYMQKVWETGNPFSPQYANCTEMLASRPWLLYVIFYSFARNTVISAKLTLIVVTVILALAAAYFFRKLDWTWPEIFLALDVFFGVWYCSLEYPVIRYTPAFSMFLIGELLTLGILINVIHNKKYHPVQIITLIGISAYFGICGIRMLLYLYLPTLLFEVIQYIHGKFKQEDVPIKSALITGGLLLVNICGVAINIFILTPYMQYGGQQPTPFFLAQFGSLWNDICMEITWLVRALGIILDGGTIFSATGMLAVYMCVLLAVIAWGSFELKGEDWLSGPEKKTLGYLTLSAAVFLFFCVFTMYSSYPRYWFATIPIIITVLAISIYRFLRRRDSLKVVRKLFCLLLIAGIGISSASRFMHQYSGSTALMQLTKHLEDNGYYRIASTYWSNSSITFLSNGKVEGPLLGDPVSLQMGDWITDRTRGTNDDEPITVLVSPDQRETWINGEKSGYLLSLADKVEDVAGYSLYHYEENPLAFNMLKFGKNARFNFISLYYYGAYLKDGMIALPNGASQYGPYIAVDAGTYDVVIRGENLERGIFDVVSGIADASNTKSYEMKEMRKSDDTITFSVCLDADVEGFEIRSMNPTDEEMAIRDITITPRDQKPLW